MKKVGINIARGFAMGSADVVPGVSGGTVALVLGIYDRLIGQVRLGAHALARLLRGDVRGGLIAMRRVEWSFLLSLLGGIVLAVVVLVGWLTTQIDENPVEVSAVFFGLVAASVLVTRNEVSRWDPPRIAVMVAVAVGAFFLLGLRSGGASDPSNLVILGAGALAICAMILPGISGSFILLMLGLYDVVTHAVDDRDMVVVAFFAVGAVIGLASFSTLLHWLLRHHRDTVVAALIGLMIGSLRVLWPWPTGEEGLDNVALGRPVDGDVAGAAAGCLVAVLAVVAIHRVAMRLDDTRTSEPRRQPA